MGRFSGTVLLAFTFSCLGYALLFSAFVMPFFVYARRFCINSIPFCVFVKSISIYTMRHCANVKPFTFLAISSCINAMSFIANVKSLTVNVKPYLVFVVP